MKFYLLVVLLLIAACTHSTLKTPIALPPVTPVAVMAKLTPVATLDEAAKQFAAALEVAPDNVRVRISTAGCNACALEANPALTSEAGVAVADAAPLLKPHDFVTLFVQTFGCFYEFDGKSFIPQGCRFTQSAIHGPAHLVGLGV